MHHVLGQHVGRGTTPGSHALSFKPNGFYHIETQMKKATGKKRIGRPPTGRTPVLSITLAKQMMDAVDKIALEEKSTRSEIVREMIVDGIRRRGKRP